MVTVEKTDPGRTTYRALGQSFVHGDRADVSEDTATWLCDERGEFERVDTDPECADENCSRTVDAPGDTCWQHSDDEEE